MEVMDDDFGKDDFVDPLLVKTIYAFPASSLVTSTWMSSAIISSNAE